MKKLLSLLAMMMSMTVFSEEESRSTMQLGSPFGDHAVLQRDVPLPIWGWGPPHTKVAITFGDEEASTYCDGNGYFRAVLPAFAAESRGRTLTVTSANGQTATCRDVLVGEVWLCAGQSNMEWPLGKLDDARARAVAGKLTDRPIRCLKVEHSVALEPQNRANMLWLGTDKAADWTGIGSGRRQGETTCSD